MFKVDMDAIREAAIESWLMANPANLAKPANKERVSISQLANLSISHARQTPNGPGVTALLEAAMRVCDLWGDPQEFREQMRRDCLETPPHLGADLLDHFTKAYPMAHRNKDSQLSAAPVLQLQGCGVIRSI